MPNTGGQDRGPVENIGPVNDSVRAFVRRAAQSRSIDELLGRIKASFKVEVKRWNPGAGRYMDRGEFEAKLAEVATRPASELAEWERYLLAWERPRELVCSPNREFLHFSSEQIPFDDLLTKVGRDLIHNASFMTGSQPAALTYYAICNPGTFSPADTDTTLNGEITTPSGLARHQPTGIVDGVTESFTHTASTNTTVVIAAFKNNGGSAVTGIKGYGNFNAAAAGTLGTESAFTSLDLNPNDILKLTVTLTLG